MPYNPSMSSNFQGFGTGTGSADSQTGSEIDTTIWIIIGASIGAGLILLIILIWLCRRNYWCCYSKNSKQNIDDAYYGGVTTSPRASKFQQNSNNLAVVTSQGQLQLQNHPQNHFPLAHFASDSGKPKEDDSKLTRTSTITGITPTTSLNSKIPGMTQQTVLVKNQNGSVIDSSIGPSVSERAYHMARQNRQQAYQNDNNYLIGNYQTSQVDTSITMSDFSEFR